MTSTTTDWSSVWRAATLDGPTAQARVLAARLLADEAYADSSARRMGQVIGNLARRLAATGSSDLSHIDARQAAAFIRAATRRGVQPSPATMRLRRTAIRLAVAQMRQVGADVDDPTRAVTIPPTGRTADWRPLSPDELTLLRVAAASRARRRATALATVALSEVGATTGEVARLRWADLDLDTGTCVLPGAGRTGARTARLTPWGRRQLHHTGRDPMGDLVVYRGDADPDSSTAQAAITTRLRTLMTAAGIDDCDVRPGSVRLTLPAAQLRHDGRVDLAARALGLDSLDVAARLLCWDWTDT